jgi:hypothetical protein
MELLLSELEIFFGSDVLSCPSWGFGFAQCYGANVLAHLAIAMLAGLAVFLLGWSYRWLVIPVLALILKEAVFDVPLGGGALLVVLDSIADSLTYIMGAALIPWAIMSEGRK